MIETLTLQNFKVLRDVEIELRPLTVIVGPNASGKSSVLQALSLITSCFSTVEGTAREVLGGGRPVDLLRTRSSEGTVVLGCREQFRGKRSFLRIEIPPAEEPVVRAGSEEIGFFKAGRVRAFSRPAVVLKLEAEKLAKPSYPTTTSLILPRDGEGLSSVLAGLYLEDISRFRLLVDLLRRVVPGVQNLHVRRAPVEEKQVGYELVFDMRGAEGIPAYAVSDGTLLTLGLLTALAVPGTPELVLIDDLERGLHPRALGELVQQLRRIQEQSPELQIVATSHSPYLLDFVAAEEVLLTSLDEDGYAAVRPLTGHPEYERWKGLMAPGEFWSTVGESWITRDKAEPAKAQ